MHHLLEVLFPYILLFFVFDCFVFVKSYQAAITSHLGSAHALKKPGFRFFGISPLSRLFMVFRLPFFISQKGIYIWNKSGWQDSDLYLRDAFEFFPFDTLQQIETDGSLLKINHRFTVDLQVPLFATQTADTFRALRELPAESRWPRIKHWIGSRFDLTEIRDTYQRSSKYLSLLEIMGVFIFAATFIFLPSFLYIQLPVHLPLFLLWILLMYVVLLVIAGITVTKGPTGAESGRRVFLSFILSPATAGHPVHHFTKYLFYAFDIAAVAAVFLDPGVFRELLRNELKRLYFSLQRGAPDDLMRSLQIREACLKELLTIAEMAPEHVLNPPPQSDDRAHSYCPLCETEYLEGVSLCPDCDIQLTPYDDTPRSSP